MSNSNEKPGLAAKIAANLVQHTPDWSSLALSQAIGAASRLDIPPPVSKAVVSVYQRIFGVDLKDVDPQRHAQGYRRFDDFFTRTLKEGARPVDPDPNVLSSPSDGFLRESVEIEAGSTIRAKGHDYSVGELLGDEAWAQEFIGGTHSTIYLHPRDYHRVHSPVKGAVESARLIPGRLLPVTDAALEVEPNLFARNERLVHRISSEQGSVAVVMVAAFGVSHMSCTYAEIQSHPKEPVFRTFSPPCVVQKGGELGIFHLGSTVILLADRNFPAAAARSPGTIQMGQSLLRKAT